MTTTENTTRTPQEAFEDTATLARVYFAQDDHDFEGGFANAFDFELLHTGGGVMVAVKKVSDTHVIGVSEELTCLYDVDLGGSGYSAADLFFNSEEHLLLSDNLR